MVANHIWAVGHTVSMLVLVVCQWAGVLGWEVTRSVGHKMAVQFVVESCGVETAKDVITMSAEQDRARLEGRNRICGQRGG